MSSNSAVCRGQRRRTIACLAVLGLGACTHHYGEGWQSGAPEPTPAPSQNASPRVFVLGEAYTPGAASEESAAALAPLLRSAPDAVVVTLGAFDDGECRAPEASPVAHLIAEHARAGGAHYDVAGLAAWRCGRAPAQDVHRVIRVEPDGTNRVVSTCDADRCELEDPAVDAQGPRTIAAELVLVDLAPWYVPAEQRRPPDIREREAMQQLRSLLVALEETADTAPPRVLVSEVPVEAAGYHGQGGGAPKATFHELPPELQQALVEGRFSGVIAALDHAVYATEDLTHPIQRSNKTWLKRPVFQVVAGSTARGARGAERLRYFNSMAYVPPWFSPSAGFAVVELEPTEVAATLWAHRIGRWRTKTVRVPWKRLPPPPQSDVPAMAPCLRCPAVPYPERFPERRPSDD